MTRMLLVVPEAEWRLPLAQHLHLAQLDVVEEEDAAKAIATLETTRFDAVVVQAGGRRLALQKLYADLGRFPDLSVFLHAPQVVVGSAIEAMPPERAMRIPSRLTGMGAARFILEKLGVPAPGLWRYEDLGPLSDHDCFSARLARPETGGAAVLIARLDDSFRTDAASCDVFLTAARSAAHIEHPGIPPLIEAGGVLPFAAYRIPEGRLLSTMLGERGHQSAPLAPPLAVLITLGVIDALEAARNHDEPTLHAALTPDTVWIGSDGRVHVLHFGTARVGETARARRGPGSRPLRKPYLAPEQVFGTRVDERTEVYRVAQLLYRLLCGRPPFLREGHFETVEAIGRDHTPDPLASGAPIGTTLAALLIRCLDKDPANRPAHNEELRAMLRDASERASGLFSRGLAFIKRQDPYAQSRLELAERVRSTA